MFRCQVTDELSKPGEPEIRVIIQERPVTYTNWVQTEDSLDRVPKYMERVSTGREIVIELRVTKAGLAALEAQGTTFRRI